MANSLIDIINTLVDLVDEETEKLENAQPLREPYIKYTVTDIKREDNGKITGHSGEQEYFIKNNWIKEPIEITNKLKGESLFKKAIEQISSLNEVSKEDAERSLQEFIRKFIIKKLEGKITSTDKDELIKNFILQIEEKSLELKAVIHTRGIVVKGILNINESTLIRQVEKEDLEKEISVTLPHREPYLFVTASSIVEIKKKCELRGLHDEIQKVITILRLFDVGSVKSIGHNITSNHILKPVGGRTFPISLGSCHNEYFINSENSPLLISFFKLLENKIPHNFYDSSYSPSYLSVAHQFYTQSLLESNTMEQRISNVVMGLEAIFLNENFELVYRLQMNISKLFALLGFDPENVRDLVKDAYKIRSKYSHGDFLKVKEKEKYRRLYGSLKILT